MTSPTRSDPMPSAASDASDASASPRPRPPTARDAAAPGPRVVPPLALVAAGGIVIGLAMGTRHVQGLFMLPLLGERGWGRHAFAFALGLQMLVWGALQPLAGYVADRWGARPVVAAGCLAYAAGLLAQAWAPTPALLALAVGGVVGVALTATTFAVVHGAVARRVPAAARSTALGLAGAVGGFVQFALVPAAQVGIDALGWAGALRLIALAVLAATACAWWLDDRPERRGQAAAAVPAAAPIGAGAGAGDVPALGALVRAALGHRGFWLLNLGFVSCGFQLAFLGTHLPAFVRDAGLGAAAGVRAIALIALANTVGTYAFGRLGDRFRPKHVLAALYAARTLAMVAFVAWPVSERSLDAFALAMGATWLGTVPLTSAVVAQIFGVRGLGTLFGLVFLGHQLGGFFGAWLGGWIFDATGSYGAMWGVAIALGAASVALNLPIRDRPVTLAAAPAAAGRP